jgi:hypothetical protein
MSRTSVVVCVGIAARRREIRMARNTNEHWMLDDINQLRADLERVKGERDRLRLAYLEVEADAVNEQAITDENRTRKAYAEAAKHYRDEYRKQFHPGDLTSE